jgi:predicted Fe-Mo cluster-binding NifX family protein
MKVCFPVFQNQGLDSLVSSDFDSAPLCVIVDTECHAMVEIGNRTPQDRYNICGEIVKRGGADAAFVVDGIGSGSLSALKQAGFKVYQAQPGTIADNLEHLIRKELKELSTPRGSIETNLLFGGDDDDDLPRFGCGF